jgi:hypothetical protein
MFSCLTLTVNMFSRLTVTVNMFSHLTVTVNMFSRPTVTVNMFSRLTVTVNKDLQVAGCGVICVLYPNGLRSVSCTRLCAHVVADSIGYSDAVGFVLTVLTG